MLIKEIEFGLNLPAMISTFRAGCILQGHLAPMPKTFAEDPNLSSLLAAFAPKGVGEGSACVPVMLSSKSYTQTRIATTTALDTPLAV